MLKSHIFERKGRLITFLSENDVVEVSLELMEKVLARMGYERVEEQP